MKKRSLEEQSSPTQFHQFESEQIPAEQTHLIKGGDGEGDGDGDENIVVVDIILP